MVQFATMMFLAVDESIAGSRRFSGLGSRLRWAWPCALAGAILALVAGIADAGGRFDPAAEGSPLSWASACAAGAAALAAALTAKRSGELRLRRAFLAAALAYVAVDDAFGLHERFAGDLDPRAMAAFDGNAVGLAAYGFLFVAVVVLLALELRRTGDRGMLAAGTALLAAALGARVVGGALAAAGALPHGAIRDAGLALDHAFQLAGWILVAAGMARIWLAPARKRRPPPDQSEATAAAQ